MKPIHHTRRHFIQSTIGTAGALFAVPQIVRAETLGNNDKAAANSRIGIGFIGVGAIAGGHVASFPGLPNVQPIAVCDVRNHLVKSAQETLKQKGFNSIIGTPKFEEILANPDVHAVCIATPDHWHAAIAIAAMKAGKDVYVEKPMTLTIEESKAVLAAEKKYGRILQVGSQQRSSVHFRMAAELVRNGVIGDIKEIDCYLGEFPQPPAQEKIVPVPAGFDYDRWLGATPFFEHSENRVKSAYRGGWRCYWEYGNRKFGDWGAHHFDIVQWALGRDDTGPVEFIPKGFEGATHHHYRYADGITVWRDKSGNHKGPMIRFIGSTGEIHVSRGKLGGLPDGITRHKFGPDAIRLYESKEHRRNFIDCIETRKAPICSASIGHHSGVICYLAAIAQKLGRAIKWDPATEQIVGDPEATAMQDRPRRPGYEMPTV